jgi:hypothetical protein
MVMSQLLNPYIVHAGLLQYEELKAKLRSAESELNQIGGAEVRGCSALPLPVITCILRLRLVV